MEAHRDAVRVLQRWWFDANFVPRLPASGGRTSSVPARMSQLEEELDAVVAARRRPMGRARSPGRYMSAETLKTLRAGRPSDHDPRPCVDAAKNRLQLGNQPA